VVSTEGLGRENGRALVLSPWRRVCTIAAMGKSREGKLLLSLYAAALLLRLALFCWKGPHHEIPIFLYARRDLPFWDILPVVCFQVFDRLTGHDTLLLGVIYTLVSAAIAPIVWSLASRLGLPRRLALWSALGVAGYPYYLSTAWYQPEVGITILLTALYAVTFLRFAERLSFGRGALAGFCGVLLLLDRPDAVMFVLFVTAFGAGRATHRLRIVPVVTAMLVVAFVTIGFVNAWGTGRFSPVPGKSGYNLLLGHNAAVNAYLRTSHATTMETFVLDEAFAGFPKEVLDDKQNAVYSSLYRDRALDFIRAHPRLTLLNTGYKLLRYWDWRLEDADKESSLKNTVYSVSYLTVLLLALLGTVVLIKQGRTDVVLFAWGGMIAFCLPGLVTIPLIRVRMYTEFLLLILAAAGIDHLTRLSFAQDAIVAFDGPTHTRGGPVRIPTERER